MKVDKITIGAVIPVAQYSNIQPSIELSEVTAEEGIAFAMNHIKELFVNYSEKGGLTEKEYNQMISTKISKKSFNEDLSIDFDPVAHRYTFNTTPLLGATTYVDKLYKPFDTENVAKACEKSWGVSAELIKELWESSGESASEYGNRIHKAIENYEKYREVGAIIQEKKSLEYNYALPSHPDLRNIVLGFENIKKIPGKVYSEALISWVEQGICGHADVVNVLDEEKKICRIGDIKANIKAEEIDKTKYKIISDDEILKNLPANKLSKCQIQMSIYANMLQAKGWTVEGLDAWYYDGEWKHYPLEVLQVIKPI